MDSVQTILSQARDAMTVKRVFGDPIERDGVTIIPVAKVGGGGGGGGGSAPTQHGTEEGQEGKHQAIGSGAGFGLSTTPAGVYVIKNGEVSWEPAVDVNRIVMGGQLLGAFALAMIFRFLRARQRSG